MMLEEDDDHRACVDAWMARAAEGLPADELVTAFEGAFSRLWQRSHRTLGDVTLMAIIDRVLYDTADQHPVLSSLTLGSAGLQTEELRATANALPYDDLAVAIRFVLVEFLTVLGNLTGDILTPALQAELRHVSRRSEEQQTRNTAIGGRDGAES